MNTGGNNFFINGSQSQQTNNIRQSYNIVFENTNNEFLSMDYNGNYLIIGYSKSYVEELQKLCLEHKTKKEDYHNLLIEKGIIEKELTQEDKLNMLINKIDAQDTKIKELQSLLKQNNLEEKVANNE